MEEQTFEGTACIKCSIKCTSFRQDAGLAFIKTEAFFEVTPFEKKAAFGFDPGILKKVFDRRADELDLSQRAIGKMNMIKNAIFAGPYSEP